MIISSLTLEIVKNRKTRNLIHVFHCIYHSEEVISSRVHKTSSKESTPKIDKEVKKMKKINNRMEKLSVNILDLKKKYNDFDVEEVMLKKRDEKK